MVPTLGPTLGVKGHRPVVGTRDCKDLLYVLAVVNVVTGVLHANTLESPARAKQKTGKSKTRRMQEAFAAHLRHVARLYPAAEHERLVLIIDNAPWHRGGPIDEALADCPHLEFYRLPSYSPQLNVIERFWKVLRRRATHNRLFDALRDLKRSIRASPQCYFQTMRGRESGSRKRDRSYIGESGTGPRKRDRSDIGNLGGFPPSDLIVTGISVAVDSSRTTRGLIGRLQAQSFRDFILPFRLAERAASLHATSKRFQFLLVVGEIDPLDLNRWHVDWPRRQQ